MLQYLHLELEKLELSKQEQAVTTVTDLNAILNKSPGCEYYLYLQNFKVVFWIKFRLIISRASTPFLIIKLLSVVSFLT